jgi:hypothetical protein
MSDLFHHAASTTNLPLNTNKEIATALDAHFGLFRIGHAAAGSDDEEVLDRARWIGLLMCALDQ